ncbi:MAG: BON domain-containing protein [Stellaceae bacterium]
MRKQEGLARSRGMIVSSLRVARCLVSLLALSALGGCAAVAVGGVVAAGAGAGYAAGQERGVTGTVDDLTLGNHIAAAWLNANPPLPGNLTATVYGGRALLTGTVSLPQTKARAGAIARSIAGVRAVYNEIAVGPGETTWEAARDAWISTRLRSALVLDSGVRSMNYNIETVDGSVYLIGSARDRTELARVIRSARYLPGVKRVVSFIEIRPGEPALAQAPSPQPVPPQPAPLVANPPAVPTPAVESHRL